MSYDDYDPDDPDAPQPMDVDDQDDEPEETVLCVGCGSELYYGTAICPCCGEYVPGCESPAAERSRGVFWPAMVGLLIAVILVVWLTW